MSKELIGPDLAISVGGVQLADPRRIPVNSRMVELTTTISNAILESCAFIDEHGNELRHSTVGQGSETDFPTSGLATWVEGPSTVGSYLIRALGHTLNGSPDSEEWSVEVIDETA